MGSMDRDHERLDLEARELIKAIVIGWIRPWTS